jgi:hypothetical protein
VELSGIEPLTSSLRIPNSRIEESPSDTDEPGATLSACIHKCLARFSVWHSTPSDTPPTPVGMPWLRHKERHNARREYGPRGGGNQERDCLSCKFVESVAIWGHAHSL